MSHQWLQSAFGSLPSDFNKIPFTWCPLSRSISTWHVPAHISRTSAWGAAVSMSEAMMCCAHLLPSLLLLHLSDVPLWWVIPSPALPLDLSLPSMLPLAPCVSTGNHMSFELQQMCCNAAQHSYSHWRGNCNQMKCYFADYRWTDRVVGFWPPLFISPGISSSIAINESSFHSRIWCRWWRTLRILFIVLSISWYIKLDS